MGRGGKRGDSFPSRLSSSPSLAGPVVGGVHSGPSFPLSPVGGGEGGRASPGYHAARSMGLGGCSGSPTKTSPREEGTHTKCAKGRPKKKKECEGAREGTRREKGSWRGWKDHRGREGEGEEGGEGGRGVYLAPISLSPLLTLTRPLSAFPAPLPLQFSLQKKKKDPHPGVEKTLPTPFRETKVRRGWSGWSILCGQG